MAARPLASPPRDCAPLPRARGRGRPRPGAGRRRRGARPAHPGCPAPASRRAGASVGIRRSAGAGADDALARLRASAAARAPFLEHQPARRLARPASGGGTADAGAGRRPALALEGGPGDLLPRRRRHSRLRLRQVLPASCATRGTCGSSSRRRSGWAAVCRVATTAGRWRARALLVLVDRPLRRGGLRQLDGSPPPVLERRRAPRS